MADQPFPDKFFGLADERRQRLGVSSADRSTMAC